MHARVKLCPKCKCPTIMESTLTVTSMLPQDTNCHLEGHLDGTIDFIRSAGGVTAAIGLIRSVECFQRDLQKLMD